MAKEMKHFNIRITKDLWLYLKHEALRKESSMMKVILAALEKYRKNNEKKLDSL